VLQSSVARKREDPAVRSTAIFDKMKNPTLARFQIGKEGLTPGVLNSLNLALRNHKQIRISVLKSTKRDKDKTKEMAEKILKKMEYKCDYRVIGFTIILIKKRGKNLEASTGKL